MTMDRRQFLTGAAAVATVAALPAVALELEPPVSISIISISPSDVVSKNGRYTIMWARRAGKSMLQKNLLEYHAKHGKFPDWWMEADEHRTRAEAAALAAPRSAGEGRSESQAGGRLACWDGDTGERAVG